ncbi:MAG: hypothetical protein DRQ59_02075 [Gammaproteobacteria bacterium]|nr:MAG: hypothetical protein DRQ59_02075 [Gammaproteobacteria bacterium]
MALIGTPGGYFGNFMALIAKWPIDSIISRLFHIISTLYGVLTVRIIQISLHAIIHLITDEEAQ